LLSKARLSGIVKDYAARNDTAPCCGFSAIAGGVSCGIAFAFATGVMKMVIISIALSALVLWALA